MGLNKERHLFVWGNRRYLGPIKDGESNQDVEEPQRVMMIKNVSDIFCCDTYALILGGERIRFIGEFERKTRSYDDKREGKNNKKVGLKADQAKSKEEDKPSYSWEVDVIKQTAGLDFFSSLKSFSLSPNHVVALAKDDLLYSWGLNDDGQLGIAIEKGPERAFVEKVAAIDEINNIIKGNKNRLDQQEKTEISNQHKES